MKKGNKLFLGIIISIFVLSIVFIFILANYKPTQTHAQVLVYGKVIRTFDLSTVEEPIEFDVESKKGCINTIRVEKGRIGIIHANCPDQLCVKRGFISNSVVPNVCLPNGVVIQITSTKHYSGDIDTLAE